jgi:hypothetical protein
MWVIENVILVRLYSIGKHEKNAHHTKYDKLGYHPIHYIHDTDY